MTIDRTPLDPIEGIDVDAMRIDVIAYGVLMNLAANKPAHAIIIINAINAMFRLRARSIAQIDPFLIDTKLDAEQKPDDRERNMESDPTLRFYLHGTNPVINVQIASYPFFDIIDHRAYITDYGVPKSAWLALAGRVSQAKTLGDLIDLSATSNEPTGPIEVKIVKGTHDIVRRNPTQIETVKVQKIYATYDPQSCSWPDTYAKLSAILAEGKEQ